MHCKLIPAYLRSSVIPLVPLLLLCLLGLVGCDTGSTTSLLGGHQGLISSIAFSPDGQLLAPGSSSQGATDNTVRLWDTAHAGTLLATFRNSANNAWIEALAFAPDGKTVASSGADRVVRLWSVDNPSAAPLVLAAGCWTLSLAFSPDGKMLVAGCLENKLLLWNLPTDLHTVVTAPLLVADNIGSVYGLAFSHKGDLLAAAGQDKRIRIWHVSNLQDARTVLTGHGALVQSLAFSPQDNLLVSGSHDGTVRLWDLLRSGTAATILTSSQVDPKNNTVGVYSVAYSPDGESIAAAGQDMTLRQWNMQSGSAIPTASVIGTVSGPINSIAYSPDGKTLAAARDRSVWLWGVPLHDATPAR